MAARSLRFITTPLFSPLSSSSSLHQNQDRIKGIITWTSICSRYFSSTVEVSEFDSDVLHDTVKATDKVVFPAFFGTRRRPAISTGSLKLDIALRIGGLPKGRIVEIYGRESSGKTTFALHVIKEAQKLGGYCVYLDVENALDPTLVETIGVNTKDLLISQPDWAENLLSMVDTLTKSRSVDVIVVDSVAALIPQQDIDIVIGDKKVRFHPGKDQGFEQAKEVTCGGNALPFYSAVRLRMIRKNVLRTNDKVRWIK